MKTNRIFLLCICFVPVVFSGCSKDDEPADTGDISNFFNNNKVQSQFFTINAASTQNLAGSEGTGLYLPSGCFLTANGTRVTSGTVEVELKEVYNIKDMILSNIPTTSNGRLLISGGQVYVAARQNGQALRIDRFWSARLSMPATNGNQRMQQFYGTVQVVNGDSTIAWTIADSNAIFPQVDSTFGTTTFSYPFNLDSLTWINCDYFYNSGTPLTEVSAVVPDTFDNVNCAVFIAFSSINSVARLTTYTSATGTFSTGSGYEVPVGISATIVAIAEKNNRFYFYSHSVTVSNIHVENITLSPSTDAAIQAALNAL